MAKRSPRAERLEWVLGFVCGAVVLGLAAYLVREGLSGGAGSPVLSVERQAGPPGEVRFVVRNAGGGTATGVAVVLRLDGGSEPRLVIDYLPGGSEASGGFVLPGGVSAGAAELAVEGYVDP